MSLQPFENAVLQDSSLLKLPSELRNRIWILALQGVVVLRAERRSTDKGQRLIFHPERPALTAVNRQLANEALGIYYTESTFYFADALLLPGVMHAFKVLRGDILNHIQTMKVQHRPQIRDHNVPWAYQRDTYCSVQFAAYVSEGKVTVKDVEVSAIDRHCNATGSPTARMEACHRFLKDLVSPTAKSQPGPGNPLIQFLTDYVQGIQELVVQSPFTCRACGRRTIQLPGACCGYMDQEVAPFFCDATLAVKRGEAFS